MEPAKIAEIKAQPANAGRELLLLTSKSAEVVFRVPGGVEMDAYRARHAGDRSKTTEANRSLLGTCLAFPDTATLQEILDRRPLLLEKWSDKLLDAGGGEEEVEAKKL